MKDEILVGQLSSWDNTRGIGHVVTEENGIFRRFYLHWSRIRAGRELAGVGAGVLFTVHKVREGKLYSAADAIISAPTEKTDASAGLSALSDSEASQS